MAVVPTRCPGCCLTAKNGGARWSARGAKRRSASNYEPALAVTWCHDKQLLTINLGNLADVAPSRFAAAVRRGHSHLRTHAVDGRAAPRRLSLGRGQGAGRGAARAGLAAAHDAGRERL